MDWTRTASRFSPRFAPRPTSDHPPMPLRPEPSSPRASHIPSRQSSATRLPHPVSVPSPVSRPAPPPGQTLAGFPTGNLPALSVVAPTHASGRRQWTHRRSAGGVVPAPMALPRGHSRRGQQRTSALIGPPASTARRCTGDSALQRSGIGLRAPIRQSVAGVPGPSRGDRSTHFGRPVGRDGASRRPVSVPVCVPFRSRPHNSWRPAHREASRPLWRRGSQAACRRTGSSFTRPPPGSPRSGRVGGSPRAEGSQRAGAHAVSAVQDAAHRGPLPRPGREPRPSIQQPSRRFPVGEPASVCPGDGAAREAGAGTDGGTRELPGEASGDGREGDPDGRCRCCWRPELRWLPEIRREVRTPRAA